MRELVNSIKRISIDDARNFILLDTSFIINILEHHKHLNLLKDYTLGVTSFNMEEILYIEHKLEHEDKKIIKKFLKHPLFYIVEIPVHPGNYDEERKFVNSVDEELLKTVSDPSDAVLIATAIKTRSTVMTKDKHHLFTTTLEEFLKRYNLKVYKDFNFLLR